MSSPESVLLVGASAAGLSTAKALRRLGYQSRLTLLDAEPRLPYDRPPLSKQVLAGSWEPSRAQLRTQAQWEALEAEFVRGEPAVALNVAERAVTTASGQVLHGDVLVIATGLTPRQLSGNGGRGGRGGRGGHGGRDGHGGHGGHDGHDGQGGQGGRGGQGGVAGLVGVHVLRTLDDALALRAHLTTSPHPRPTASLRVHPAGCADLAACVHPAASADLAACVHPAGCAELAASAHSAASVSGHPAACAHPPATANTYPAANTESAANTEPVAGMRLVVVGEGVLGAEIAATARTMGLDVTLAGMGRAPLGDQLGDVVGAMIGRMHAEHGVRLRLSTAVEGLTGVAGRVTGVRLATGELLPADAVVVAIGSRPATGWLADSGLTLGDGVECDSRCRAAEGVYAVGDVASWWHEGLSRRLRLENRTNATEQAQIVAANILGADRPYMPIPYFWTDQYDVKIQAHGLPSPAAEVTIAEGDPEQRRFVAVYREAGEVTGVLGWNMPKQVRLLRQQFLRSWQTASPLTPA